MARIARIKSGFHFILLPSSFFLVFWTFPFGIDFGVELASTDHFLKVADDGAARHAELPRRVDRALVVKNGSKTRATCSGAIPHPKSRTDTVT
jgi:hypothetical protein